MFKLLITACMLAVAAAKPSLLAYSSPFAYTSAAYTAPIAAAYSSPYAYSPVAAAYTAPVSAPLAYSAYTAPVSAYSAYGYASPYSAYYVRR